MRLGQEVQALPRRAGLSAPRFAGLSRAQAERALAAAFASSFDDPAREARLLLRASEGVSAASWLASPDAAIVDSERAQAFAARRLAGEPLSRILGRRGFWSFDLEISPAVLDPRADTEALVDAALNALHARRGEALRVLDFGTGSGAILAALLSELPNATGVGIDVSEAAAAQARGNFAALGLARRAQFVVSDWGASLGGETFDLIVSNPPYIPSEAIATLDVGVRAHDPILALDGGADGFDAFRKLAPQVARLLAADGWFFFEMGQGQGDTLWAMLGVAGLAPTTRFCDLSGIARGIGGRRA